MPELLWHMVEEGIKRPKDLGLLGLSYVRLQGPKEDLFWRGLENTLFQDQKKCACVSITNIVKCSVSSLLCVPGLMIEAITETSLLIAKGMVRP